MKNKSEVDNGRRDLLKGVASAAVVGAVVAGTSQAAEAKESRVTASEPTKAGYRETQHVRDYYDTL
ncbi:twin-arginine translocation signal domain-containing protein [Vibrio cholerae]